MNARYTKLFVALGEAGQAVARRWQEAAAGVNDKNRRAALAASPGNNQCGKARSAAPVRFKKLVPTACGILLMALNSQVLAGNFVDPISGKWYYKFKNDDGNIEIKVADVVFVKSPLQAIPSKPNQEKKASQLAQVPNSIYHNAYQTDTSSFTKDTGEPLINGMTHTFGRFYKASRNERVVLNTYGSSSFSDVSGLDTVLVVYRIDFSNGATGVKALKRVAVNDNKNIPGHFSGASLVQFDAVKGEHYVIQVGSKNEGGDVLLTGFTFPPSGGLTIQPLSIYSDSSSGGGYGYACNLIEKFDHDNYYCQDAGYIVHNSTAKTLTVTASTGFGDAFIVPKPFTLPPGAAVVKTFVYNRDFNNDTARTLSGGFSFTGKAGSTVAAQITLPGRITVHAGLVAVEPKLKLTAKPQVLSGGTGEVFTFPVAIKNIGTVPATACYATIGYNENTLQTAWAAYDPVTQQVTGNANAPFDIAVGKTVNILVAMRSFTDRLADPDSQRPIEIGCANASDYPNPGQFDLINNVDFTNTVTKYPKLTLVKTSPENSIFSVPAPGNVFSASFRNDGSDTAEVTAVVDENSYNNSTGEDQPFGVAVCSAAATVAACLASTAHELPLSIKPGKTAVVKVAVRYPAEVREFSPDRGVSLLLKHDYDTGGFVFPDYIPLTGTTKALVRKP